MAFRIAQISDTHLSETRPYFVDNFVRIGEAIRAAKPDLVVNTGDMSLDGASEDGDLAASRLLHDALGLPLDTRHELTTALQAEVATVLVACTL